MPLNLKNTTTAFQFFQVTRYLALLLGSIFLTKSTVSQIDIGVYETILLMSGSLSFFWVNGILTTFLRSYTKAENKSIVISNTFYLLFTISAVFLSILLIFQNPVLSFFHLDKDYYLIFILFFIFNALAFFVEYILLAADNYRALYRLGIFHLFLQTLSIALPAFFMEDITFVIRGILLFIGLKFFILLYLLFRQRLSPVNYSFLKEQMHMALPLTASFFLGGIAIYVDGIIVNAYFGKATFAMYQYGAKEFPVTSLLASALSVSMIQKITAQQTTGISELKTRSMRLMHILFPVSIVLMALSKYLYPLIFNAQFSESYLYFNIYLLLLIPRLLFPQSILTALGKTKLQLSASLAEFTINITASLLLLQTMGLAGVAMGTVIAYCAEKIIYIIYLKKNNLPVHLYTPIKHFIIYSILLILAFILFTF